MAKTSEQHLGQRTPFGFRYSPEMPPAGMMRRRDGGIIRPPKALFLQNARWTDGLGGRPGLRLQIDGLGAGAANTAVNSIYDFQSDGRTKLYIIFDGCPGVDTAAGSSFNSFDYDQSAPFGRGFYNNTLTVDMVLAFHDDQLYVAQGAGLYIYSSINVDYEQESIVVAGINQAELLKTFTGFKVSCLASAFGELYIGLKNDTAGGIGNSKIVRYDGTAFRDDKTAIDPPTVMKFFRDEQLVVGFSTSGLQVRSSAGAWTAVAGAITTVGMESFRDNLYLTGNADKIWKYDGAALAVDHTIATAANIYGIAESFGYLYFGWKSTTPAAIIGRLDSALAYTDTHKNLTTQDAAARLPKALTFYRGTLIAGVNTAANGGRIYVSPGTNTAGTYDVIIPNVANNGDLVAFVVR